MKSDGLFGRARALPPGFSLIEILVSMVILLVIATAVFGITNHVSKILHSSSAKIEAFQDARSSFDIMTRAISNATLNVYLDYYDANRKRRGVTDTATTSAEDNFVPSIYGRYSELEFVSGKSLVSLPRPQITHSVFFSTPSSYTETASFSSARFQSLINATGFYIEFYNDGNERPSFASGQPRWRFRLMQMLQPTENFSGYNPSGHDWFTVPIAAPRAPVRLLAENVIACVIWPKLPTETSSTANAALISPDFEYDSNIGNATPPVRWTSGPQPKTMNQLPPVVRLVMIAADERSIRRLQGGSTSLPDLGFDYSKVFQSPDKLEDDLKKVSDALTAKSIDFRIFQTDIALQGAKWTP